MIHPVSISSSYGKLLLDNSDARAQFSKTSSHFIGLKLLVLVPSSSLSDFKTFLNGPIKNYSPC